MELDRRSLLLGIGAIGAFLAIDLGAVAYVNDWIGPRARLTRETFMDGFQRVYGPHPGFRRNHAKGVAVTGHFDSNGNGSELSRAAVFRPGRASVTGRFSLTGGHPMMTDTPAAARGLGLAFTFPDGTQWRIGAAESAGVSRQFTARVLRPATGVEDGSGYREARPGSDVRL